MSERRRRGRPRTRWLDDVNNIKGPSVNSMRWDAGDRAKWRSATAVVARDRKRLDGSRYQGNLYICADGEIKWHTVFAKQYSIREYDTS